LTALSAIASPVWSSGGGVPDYLCVLCIAICLPTACSCMQRRAVACVLAADGCANSCKNVPCVIALASMTFHQDGAVGGGVFMQDADSTMVEVMTAADGGLWAAAVAAGSCGGACVRGAQRWLRSCGRRTARSFARCCCSRRSRWLHTTMSDDGPSQACSGWVGAPPPRAGDARTCVRGAQRGMRCCGRQTAGGARRHGSRWPAGPRRQRASATLVGHPTVDRAVLVAGRRRAAAGRQLRRRVPATHVRALLRTAGGGRRALPLAAWAGAAGTRAVDEVAEELVGSGACVDGQ
jgi:hypothetical protein